MDLGQIIQKQTIMRRVLLSLLPILVFSIFLFGWRMLALLAVVLAAGLLSEYAAMRLVNGKAAKISEAALVSCLLFTLTLPPSVPFWVAAVGIAFGLFFGKGIFGGFGRNIFNPALVGRCLIYVSFPTYMTVRWSEPFAGFPGGFARFTANIDAIASATPLVLYKSTGATTDPLKLFLGTVAGSAGETSALLILLAAVYLIATKTASWKIMLSCTATFTLINALLYFTGVSKGDPLFSLLSGGFLFAAVFMATDPVSAPINDAAKILYGILIAAAAVFIRTFSLFTEGVMFAILVGNTFAPMLDRQIKSVKARRKKVTT